MKLPPPPLTSDETFREAASGLQELTRVGCCGQMLGEVVNLTLFCNGRPRMPTELSRYVTGSLIVHQEKHAGSNITDHPIKAPHRYKEQIHWERAQIGLGISPFMVSPTEIAMVMYVANLTTPLEYTGMADIFLWASSHALSLAADGKDGLWKALNHGMTEPPAYRSLVVTDDMVLNQEPWKSRLRTLSEEVRRKVVTDGRDRERAHPAPQPEEADLLAH